MPPPGNQDGDFLPAAPSAASPRLIAPLSLSRLVLPQLPTPLTKLIGREAELATVSGLLTSGGARLVSLIGPGGIGKTRLAIAATQALTTEFADGVAWISLAAISEPSQLLPVVARALGIVDGQHRGPVETLSAALQDSHLLLVLDNFEHVVEASADLANLLHRCPRLCVLVTSRTRLQVRGEHVVHVPPLALEGASGDVADAVALLIDRIAEANSTVHFDADAIQVATEICRHVDGLPLAIELAAAHANYLPLDQLRDRMEDRLSVLTGGPRDLPERHQTLRAAIAWSYDQLGPEEQALLCRLSVFSAGFSLDAAEAMGSEPGTEVNARTPSHLPVIAGLRALVDKSLVRYERDDRGGARYWMLETIREFAAEQLAATPDEAAARSVHARWMAALAERAAAPPLMPTPPDILRDFDVEAGNLWTALAWWEASGDVDGFLRLSAAMGWYWWNRSLWDEARPWLSRAWAWASQAADPQTVSRLAFWHGIVLAASTGALDEAERIFCDGLVFARTAESAAGESALLVGLGWIAGLRGSDANAAARFRRARARAEAISDPNQRHVIAATILTNLGGSYRASGALEEAYACHVEALAQLDGIDAPLLVGQNLIDLGILAQIRGDLPTAEEHLRDGLRAVVDTAAERYMAFAIDGLGVLLSARGDARLSTRLLAVAQGMRDCGGVVERSPGDRQAREAALARNREALGEAAHAEAWTVGYGADPNEAARELLSGAPGRLWNSIALTAREQEIIALLAQGLSDRAIGEALYITNRTVEGHVGRIYRKLGVRTREDAVAVALDAGILDPGSVGASMEAREA